MSDMTINQKFEENWKIVESTFDEFKQSNILPITIKSGESISVITEDSLREQLTKSKNELFTIAVCGQVKAGKSTLLNSLFFKDNVLPTFDTPMTAKLTFLEYKNESSSFKAEFYTQEDWDRIQKDSTDESRKQLDERVQFCAQAFGIRKENCLGREPIICNDLNQLEEFVSVPKKMTGKVKGNCGKYTPFVKQVTIYLNEEILKNIRVVDTPGLNDSNVINSLQTTEWIKNAHAVVYVLDVTGAHDADVQFFRQHFPSSVPDARIFVQNKIDTNSDWNLVKNAIFNYGKDPIYKELNLFQSGEVLCSYSGLISLCKSKKEKNIALSEDEEYSYEYVGGDNFDPNPDNLEGKISDKLFNGKNGGKIRIARALGEFDRIGTSKLSQLKLESLDKKEQIKACNLKKEELENKLSDLNAFKNEISEQNENFKANNEKKFNPMFDKLNAECRKINSSIQNKTFQKIEFMRSTDEIKSFLPNFFMNAIRNEYINLKRYIDKTKDDIYEYFKDIRNDLIAVSSKYNLHNDLVDVVKWSDTNYNDIIDDEISKLSDFSSNLESVLPGSFMDFFTRMSTIVTDSKKSVVRALEELYNRFENISYYLKDQTKKQADNYVEEIQKWIDGRNKKLTEVQNNIKDKEDLKQQYENEYNEIQNQIVLLEQKVNKFKDLCKINSL